MKTLLALILCIASSAAGAQSYPYFFPGGDLNGAGSTWNAQFIGVNNVSNAKLAQATGPTMKCQPLTATANQQDCNPVVSATMLGAVVLADVASTVNITLSGLQAIDGVAGYAGEVVLTTAQTVGATRGLWVMQSGAWVRPANFASGFVITQFCNYAIQVESGTANQGHTFKLNTTTGALTIDTSGLVFTSGTIATATSTSFGVVEITGAVTKVPSMTQSPTVASGAIGDCASFTDLAGSIGDAPAFQAPGPCALTDVNGHNTQQNASFLPPTSNHGTIGCAAQDGSGCITGLSGVTSLTLTFAGDWLYSPSCFLTGNPTPAIASTVPAGTPFASVTWTLTAYTGTLYYGCL